MNWLRHPITLLAFTLFSSLFSLSLYSSWRRNQASGSQVAVTEKQVIQMTQEVAILEKRVQSASSAASQEKIIRDQLLMQLPDEQIMQIPEISERPVTLPNPSPSPSNWHQWQELLWK